MMNIRLWLKTFVFSLFICIAFIGCVSTPKETTMHVVNAVEVLGRNGARFQDRLLRIVSKGNEFTEAETVRENALIRATWETHQLGYEYFMIISEDSNATRSTYTTSGSATTRYDTFGNAYTTYNPGHTYNSTCHTVVLIILACSEDELFDDVPTFAVNSRLSQAQEYFDKTEGENNGE